jgi:hypothetical protein
VYEKAVASCAGRATGRSGELAAAALGEWPAAARLGEGASVCPGQGPAPLLKRPAQRPRG